MLTLTRLINIFKSGLKFNNQKFVGIIQLRHKKLNDSLDSLTHPIDEKKVADPDADSKQSYLADPWEILYGAERFEIAMKSQGYDDPYDSEAVELKCPSTKDDPNLVLSIENERIVACICETDSHHINYMKIHIDETKRCECGHWFKCFPRDFPDLSKYGIIGKHVH